MNQITENPRVKAVAEALGNTLIDIDPTKLATDDMIEFVAAMDAQLFEANRIVQEAMLPMRQASQQAKDALKTRFPKDAREIPHPTFFVKLEQKSERTKYVVDFLNLKDLIPQADYNQVVYPKSISGAISPGLIKQAGIDGAKVEYGVDLRKADAIAKKYGGEVKAIIEQASPRVNLGEPYLVIEPRKGVD